MCSAVRHRNFQSRTPCFDHVVRVIGWGYLARIYSDALRHSPRLHALQHCCPSFYRGVVVCNIDVQCSVWHRHGGTILAWSLDSELGYGCDRELVAHVPPRSSMSCAHRFCLGAPMYACNAMKFGRKGDWKSKIGGCGCMWESSLTHHAYAVATAAGTKWFDAGVHWWICLGWWWSLQSWGFVAPLFYRYLVLSAVTYFTSQWRTPVSGAPHQH